VVLVEVGFHRGFTDFYEVEGVFKKAIEENKRFFEVGTAVDLGAGGGSFSKILCGYAGLLYAVDVSVESVEALEKNLEGERNVRVLKVDESKMPFKRGSVNLVFAANSFHDLPKGYEKEINRVLKKNGFFVDLDWKKKATGFGPPVGIRLSEVEVEERLERVGFKIERKLSLRRHYMLFFRKVA
jgi:SAM-dependent methyltransferase